MVGSILQQPWVLFSNHNTCVDTPQQNGIAEGKNRHLLEVARSLMFTNHVPKHFWGEAILTATYLINRMPSRVIKFQKPRDILLQAFPHVKSFSSDLPLKVFGCSTFVHIHQHRTKLDPKSVKCIFLGYSSHQKGYKCYSHVTQKMYNSMDVTFFEHQPYFPQSAIQRENLKEFQLWNILQDTQSVYSSPQSTPTSSSPSLQFNSLDTLPPKRGKPTENLENATQIRDCQELEPEPVSESHTGMDFSTYEPCVVPFVDSDLSIAQRKELPQGKKPVDCKWIFTVKYKADGSIERFKARLVAKGFPQSYGIDYQETFAPFAKLNTVCVLLLLAVNEDWPLYQLDIKNAFLNGDLEEDVYMEIPPGLENSTNSHHADHTVFVKSSSEGKISILIVYVDDIILTGDDSEEISSLKRSLASEFETKDLGTLRYFLGMEVARSKMGIVISQRKYILDLLTETGMLGCKPAYTPMDSNLKLRKSEESVPVDKGRYQRLVGKLILSLTY
ncbi:transmembrane signal receptor [Lithospermum erythrorhizon]|uniref:Transmembrane signal receptor n=1 Tax=Lithospermum erythrorhizon TaxID=34254 RepID=A0AAV3PAI7_LITER